MRPTLAFLLVGLALRAASGPKRLELSPLERLQTDAVSYAQAQAADLNGTYMFRVAGLRCCPGFPPEASSPSRRTT